MLGARRPLRISRPTDPWTEHDRNGKPMVRLYDILPRLAEAYGIDVVADAYRFVGDQLDYEPLPAGQELRLYYVLNQYALRTSRWTREGEIFHVRHYDWYRVRQTEGPERVAERLAQEFRRRPQFSLPEAARLALVLNEEQLRQLDGLMREYDLWLGQVFALHLGDDREGQGRHAMLQLFGSLAPAQQRALLSGRPIASADLPPAALRWLRHALNRLGEEDPGQIVPSAAENGILSLSLRPFPRRVTPKKSSYYIDYPARELPGEPVTNGTVDLDSIPEVPGLVPPEPGVAAQARFVYRTSAERSASWSLILPRIDRRTPEVQNAK